MRFQYNGVGVADSVERCGSLVAASKADPKPPQAKKEPAKKGAKQMSWESPGRIHRALSLGRKITMCLRAIYTESPASSCILCDGT
jgi:hypothetical protein